MMNDPSLAPYSSTAAASASSPRREYTACCVLFVLTSGTRLGGHRRSSWT